MMRTEDIAGVKKFQLARSIRGRGLYFTACYWVDGLLIDTGCAHTSRELAEGLVPLPVERIVHTHSHEDHIGANALLQARYGVEASVHPLGLPVLAAPREKQPLHPYRKVMWGYPQASAGSPLPAVLETAKHRFRVIPTPGHSPDHVSFQEPEQGWFFSGDAYIGGHDRALRADYDVWGIIASLRKMAQQDIQFLFPGSGSVRRRPGAEIREKIDYLEDLGGKVHELRRQGLGIGDIRRKLLGRELPLAYLTLGHFSGRNLIRSFLGGPGAQEVFA